MLAPIRAVYEAGHLRLLDPINLTEGQAISVLILSDQELVRAALGDLMMPVDEDDIDIDVEQLRAEVEHGFQGKRSLSEIILGERDSQQNI